ncbi:MAG: spore germination protein [Oscillospiraceae bacterium]|nr:spore germination protein [Oscillospiraceae bacterium]
MDRNQNAFSEGAKALEARFARCADFTLRRVDAGLDPAQPVLLCWLDGLVDGRDLAATLLRPLTEFWRLSADAADFRARLLGGAVTAWSVTEAAGPDEAADALTHGCCALFPGDAQPALCFELRAGIGRSVSEPTLEKSVKGGRESFVETLRVNTALLRRRLATPELKLLESSLGRRSATKLALLYLEGAADEALVASLAEKLDALELDAVLSTGPLEQALSASKRSPFPQVLHTERPDRMALHLAAGRVGLLADGLPLGLILPATLAEFMTPGGERSRRGPVGGMLSLLRALAFLLALLLPGLYVALAMYHQEMIPTKLLLSMIEAKQKVPFSTALEVLGMLLAFLLLQEAGLRLPGPMGDTVSIIGALIVGQAAVEARLVSPVAIIVVAAAGIAGYALPSQDLTAALRLWSVALLLAGALAGLYGLALGCCLLLWHLAGIESFGRSYLAPLCEDGPGPRKLLQRLRDRRRAR